MRVYAPKHLREPTKKWWRYCVKSWDLDQHHVKLLTLAAESWDRVLQAREAIDELGIVYDDRFGTPRQRPEVKVELDSRRQFAQLLRQLNLDEDSTPDNYL